MRRFTTFKNKTKNNFPIINKVRPVTGFIIGLGLLLSPAFSSASSDIHKNHANKTDVIPAPGYSELGFSAPQAGTYELPPLGKAGDGNVLGSNGEALRLHDLVGDKITLLSFIYSSCNDVNGCPLATYVMSRVQERVLNDDELNNQLRIISLSFDPKQDTPQVMRDYASSFIKSGFEWHFLTSTGDKELVPILDTYNQSVQRELNGDGEEIGTISHILRVFLIDREKRIRNIYSTAFLHTDILVNDVRTLIREDESTKSPGKTPSVLVSKPSLHGAGDNKDGYENETYRTRALSLENRIGKPANLKRYLHRPPSGLPAIDPPADNPVTLRKIELGRQLFFDRRLSHNNTLSCAMCHIPEQGFTSNEMATAVGIEGRSVRRNSPTLYNVGYQERYFHDARETTLEQQIWGPLLAKNEMGNPSIGFVIEKLQSLPDYIEKFKQAFDGKPPSMDTIGKAIASYQRVLVSANSLFDQWYFNKDKSALSASAKRGFKVFTVKGNCIACHKIGNKFALFADNQLHNTGIGYNHSMKKGLLKRKILVAPGQYLTIDGKVLADAAEPILNDLGQYEITGKPVDRWKYKTPTLRNVALTAPYMHDGSISSLQDVIRFYNQGGFDNELLDPLIKPLNLTEQQSNDLVSFLNSLTGDNIDEIIADAFAAPVGNIKND
ncbi:MAG: SCO family protein [Proteobacteria bacterium]|nr:SCO family protein [Pseudomonadota bacterium]